MSASRQFNRPLLNSSALAATHNSNTIANIITTGGNIGVGTNSPDCNLHLYSSSTEPIIGLQSANQSIFGLQTISDAGSAGIKIGTYGAGSISSNVSFFSKIGNVGIGTTSPMYKLDVMGSGDFSTFVTTGALYSTNQTTTNIVATASTITNLSIPGTLTVVNITSTNLVETNITAGGIVVTGGSLRATFNSNTIGNIFTTGGNVGVGTGSPVASLQVQNNLGYSVLNSNPLSSQVILTSSSQRLYIGTYYTGGAGAISSIQSSDYYSNQDNYTTLLLNPLGGNVGIGISTSTSKLTVAGAETTANGNNASIMLINTSATSGHKWQIRAGAVGTNTPVSGLSIADSLDYRMVFTSTGNVGIANLNPAYTLDVNGTLEASNSNGLMLFASSGNLGVGTTSPGATLAVQTLNTSTIPFTVYSNGELYNPTGTNSGRSIWYNSGTVISIANATNVTSGNQTATLIDIGAYIPGSGNTNIYLGCASGTTSNGSGNFVIGRRTGLSTWSETFRINAVGNVGIGTTSPGNLLSIQGTGGTTGTLAFHNSANPVPYVGIGYNQTADGLSFYYNNGSNLLNSTGIFMSRVNSGLVGIGTTSPTGPLTIASGSNVITNLTVDNYWRTQVTAGNATVSIVYNYQSGKNVYWGEDSDTGLYIFRGRQVQINGGTGTDRPLYVAAGANNYNFPTAGYYFNTNTTITYAGAGWSPTNSILAAGGIASNVGFFATSDIRIKNISDTPIDTDLIDALNPVQFTYKDILNQGTFSKFGFIAQNVKEHIPGGISIRKDTIPDIFKKCNIDHLDGKIHVHLENHDLENGDNIKVMVDSQDRTGRIVSVVNVIDTNTFVLELDLPSSQTELFIYGREVDDLLDVDYNIMSTLAFAGVKELRQNYKSLQEKNQRLEEKNQRLDEKYNQLLNFIQNKFPGELN